ncbi:unnamed protein product [Merluccius merluccius]
MMRMMAMNGGMMNGGMMNPGMMNGANPAMMGGRGLVPPMGPGGGPGFGGQPFAQGSPMLPPYIFQQQPEVLFTPQVVNLNPQIGGPYGPQGPQFLFPPNQGNQQPHLNTVILPNGQQDQLGPLDPNTATGPMQPMQPMQPHNPVQGYPYYLSPYGYPQRNPMMLQPNQGQVNQVNQQALERTTQKPQLPLQVRVVFLVLETVGTCRQGKHQRSTDP